VDSIYKYIDIDFEIIVWDNDSKDDSVILLEQLHGEKSNLNIIKSTSNLGFAKANNKAYQYTKGHTLHFLNPDTLVNEQLNSHYKEIIINNEDLIYVTSLYEQQSLPVQTTYKIPTLSNYLYALFAKKKVTYWSIGASIIMKSSVFEKIGLWSDIYFMYAEDMDLFYTAHKLKIAVKYLDTQIIHVGKVSSGNTWSNFQRALQIEKSLKKFYTSHKIIAQYYIIRPIQFVYMCFKNKKELRNAVKAYFYLFFRNY